MGWKLSRWDSTVKESAPKVGRLPTLVTAWKRLGLLARADGEGGDVDAVGGQQLGVGREVDGGDGVARAVAAARGGGAEQTAKGRPSSARAWLTSPAAMSVRMRLEETGAAAQEVRGVAADGEAEVAAEGCEAVHVGCGLVAEAEVFALVDLADVERVAQDVACELARGEVARARR